MSVPIAPVADVVTHGSSLTTGKLSGYWAPDLPSLLYGRVLRPVKVINTGQGSMNSQWAKDNAQERVAAFHSKYILTEGFAINGEITGLTLAQHLQNIRDFVAIWRSNNPTVDITLQTMNPVGSSIAAGRPNLATWYQAERDICDELGLRLLDHYPNWPNPLPEFNTDNGDGLHPLRSALEQYMIPALVDHCSDWFNGVLPNFTVQPSIASADLKVGTPAVVSQGAFAGVPLPALSVKWRRNKAIMAGVTGLNRVYTADDVGTTIDAMVILTNAKGKGYALTNQLGKITFPGTAPQWQLTDVGAADRGVWQHTIFPVVTVPTDYASWPSGLVGIASMDWSGPLGKPQIIPAAINDEPALYFDGGDWLLGTARQIPGNAIYYAVFKPDDTIDRVAYTDRDVDTSTWPTLHGAVLGGKVCSEVLLANGTVARINGPNATPGGTYVCILRTNGTAIELRVNGTVYTMTAASPVLGGRVSPTAGSKGNVFNFKGYIRTLGAVADVTDDMMNRIEGRLLQDLGMVSFLPIGHPYKTTYPALP